MKTRATDRMDEEDEKKVDQFREKISYLKNVTLNDISLKSRDPAVLNTLKESFKNIYILLQDLLHEKRKLSEIPLKNIKNTFISILDPLPPKYLRDTMEEVAYKDLIMFFLTLDPDRIDDQKPSSSLERVTFGHV